MSENNTIPVKELRQLKNLFDKGILTRDEYSRKKKQLLGIPIESAENEPVEKEPEPAGDVITKEEQYGEAWMMINSSLEDALAIFEKLDKEDFIEATIALAMFTSDKDKRKALIKKASDNSNAEGMWQYSSQMPHSHVPNFDNENDSAWAEQVFTAAYLGSADAMNESGNIYHRLGSYDESMYWYVMANAHDHDDANVSMDGLASEWNRKGRPYVQNLDDDDEYKCAMMYLELHAGLKPKASLEEIISATLNGTTIAGYLAGDILEAQGDFASAYKMYNALCYEGDAHAMRCCADMIMSGRMGAVDIEKARNLYSKAADGGEVAAMFVMGEMLRKENKKLAAYYYGMAHARGYKLALGRLMKLQ